MRIKHVHEVCLFLCSLNLHPLQVSHYGTDTINELTMNTSYIYWRCVFRLTLNVILLTASIYVQENVQRISCKTSDHKAP